MEGVQTKAKTGVVDHLVSFLTTGSGRLHADIAASSGPQPHPLDPLSPDEISQASAICKLHAQQQKLPSLRFNAITLQVTGAQLHLVVVVAWATSLRYQFGHLSEAL